MFQRLRARVARPGWLIILSLLLVASGLVWASRSPIWPWAGLGFAGLGGLLLLVGCLIVFPPLFAGPAKERDHNRLVLENEIRTTLLQALLGVVVLLGAVSGWQQFMGTSQELKISRNTQITEQLSAATEQLGADEVEVRLGAIYTLERLLRTAEGPEGEEDSLTVYKLLAGYIKARSPWPTRPLDEDEQRRRVDRYMPLEIGSLGKRAPDVQLALEVVGRRDKELPPGRGFTPFLGDTDLRGATLSGLQLKEADLRGAQLDFANARMPADKKEEQTDLSGANLQKASLRCAHLEGTDLTDANLKEADLRDAVLKGFKRGSEVRLLNASLERPDHTHGADLTGAVYNLRTQWPDGFDPKDHPMRFDDTTLAIRGEEVLTVKGGSPDKYKTVVQDGVAVERNGKSLRQPEPVTEAEVLPCDGKEINHRLYRPGMVTCPPIADSQINDSQCEAARKEREEAVLPKSVAEQFLEELRTAAK